MPLIKVMIVALFFSNINALFTIVLDPSDADRQLASSFAKGATMQCAQKIKMILEEKYPISVIITRSPGIPASHESYAQISNRMQADLYIHLSFFQETSVQPHGYIYYHAYGNECYMPLKNNAFYTYESAHIMAHTQTVAWSNSIYQVLKKYKQCSFEFPLGIPCAPLIGVLAPAYMIEIGLHTDDAWQVYIEPICTACAALIIN
jgi:hypothetical protein